MLGVALRLGARTAPRILRGRPTTISGAARFAMQQSRSFCKRSLPKRGHTLETYFCYPESAVKMMNPLAYYFFVFMCMQHVFCMASALPMYNYYMSGRLFPKEQGHTLLCENSW